MKLVLTIALTFIVFMSMAQTKPDSTETILAGTLKRVYLDFLDLKNRNEELEKAAKHYYQYYQQYKSLRDSIDNMKQSGCDIIYEKHLKLFREYINLRDSIEKTKKHNP